MSTSAPHRLFAKMKKKTAGIAPPEGGTTIDGEARASIDLILAALRHHGLIAP